MKKIYSILAVALLSLLAVSCNSDLDEALQSNDAMGYLKLDFTTLVSTTTRANGEPAADYDPKKLTVVIKNKETGEETTVNSANNNDKVALIAGAYTVTASSANWDGKQSAFDAPYYMGSTEVTVKPKTTTPASVTLTQANVKVSVTFDEVLPVVFKSISLDVESKDVLTRSFGPDEKRSAYFPAAPISFTVKVTNKAGNQYSGDPVVINDVEPRDHFKVNVKLANEGFIGGGIIVEISDDNKTYTFNEKITIFGDEEDEPTFAPEAMKTKSINAASNNVLVQSEVTPSSEGGYDLSKLKVQYKTADASEWTLSNAMAKSAGTDKFSFAVSGLNANTQYVCRVIYNDEESPVVGNEIPFTTLYNSEFENWWNDGKITYANEKGTSYWCTSNNGSAGVMGAKYNVTTGVTDGAYKNTSAQLQSKFVVIKFAAASLFTGNFDGMIGTNGAKLSWGVPFETRPTALKGYMKYATGAINRGSQPSGIGAPAKDENDACQIFCALLSEKLYVANAEPDDEDKAKYEMSMTFDWANDSRVIAYGQLTQNTSDADWKPFNIPLTYHSTATPKYMLIVCSSSKWGDYFYGYDKAKLMLDDFTFEYEAEK